MGCTKSKVDVPPLYAANEDEPLIPPPSYDNKGQSKVIEGWVDAGKWKIQALSTMPATTGDVGSATVTAYDWNNAVKLESAEKELWIYDIRQCAAAEHLIRGFGITEVEYAELVFRIKKTLTPPRV